jgi:beta-glucosidase
VFPALNAAIADGNATVAQLDVALGRALRTRFAAGLLDPPGANPALDNLTVANTVDSAAHRALALEAAQAAVVLLKNEGGLLPLRAGGGRKGGVPLQQLCVFGPTADNANALRGDYSPSPSFITTVRAGLTARVASAGAAWSPNVSYLAGCSGGGASCVSLDPALANVSAGCDVSVVVVGLYGFNTCGCGAGMSEEGECCDRTGVDLPGQQLALLQTVQNRTRGGRVAVVAVNGGFVDLTWADGNVPAVLHVAYPCQAGGTAVAGALFGDFNPAGRLSSTWYGAASFYATVPAMSNYTMVNRTYRYHAGPHLFPFGFGRSYTSFAYSSLQLSAPSVGPCDVFALNVTVTNDGDLDGEEVVQLYLTLANASVPVPLRTLAGFARVAIPAGRSARLTFEVPQRARAVMRAGDFVEVVEPGGVALWVGGGQPGLPPRTQAPGMPAAFSVGGAVTPLAQCDAGGGAPRPPLLQRGPVVTLLPPTQV